MRVPKAYIETSVFNFVFADDAPDRQQDARQFFDEIRQGRYVPFTSDYVIRELARCSEPKRSAMVGLIDRHGIITLPLDAEAERLAAMYVADGIIPEKYVMDGVHIAIATVHDLDFIVSYNFKHIVKRKTVTMTEGVNLREGYKRVGIFSPTEVIDNDD
jgi:hypothetical protein